MGFWYKVKKFFGHTIDINDKDESRLVSMAKKSGKILLNTVLSVKPNFVAVFVVKDKIADIFYEGQYKLTPTSLPVTNRLINLSKVKKNGRSVTAFKGYVYYVNLSEFKNVEFFSYKPVFVKSKTFLGANVKVGGKFDFKVFNAISFLEALFTQFAFVKSNIALEQVKIWVGNNAVKKIEKNRPTIEELYERDTKCFNGVVDFLNARFSTIGLRVSSFEITETKLPASVYKKVKLSYEEMKQGQKVVAPERQVDQKEQRAEDLKNTNILDKTDYNLMQDKKELSYEHTNTNDNIKQYEEQKTEPIKLNETIVTPEIIKKTVTYKKCSKCGAVNPANSKVCFNCGKPFGKICPKCGTEVDPKDYVCPNCKTVLIK